MMDCNGFMNTNRRRVQVTEKKKKKYIYIYKNLKNKLFFPPQYYCVTN